MLELFLFSMLLGAIAGLLAGLFGLGGGVVIVPALVWLFSAHHFPAEQIMIMAIATSLATIIPTSISSILMHQKLGNILWHNVSRLIPGILIGAGVGAFIADTINAELLKQFFIAYLVYVGFRMALQKNTNAQLKKPNDWLDYIVGKGIGLLSSLLGIGGGTITVPYLVSRQIEIKNAVAVSSACGLAIAVSGTLVFAFLGWNQPFLPEWSLGYVYLPVLCGIIICSILTAPIGAKLASKLPAKQLKQYFSIMIFLIAFKMIFN
ncbi:MAG: sulfite exporter TauE/SafE family protein [Methylococcaceae bacterium]|nr:sulfite exporter TauE/SafE family protein [Methylococcaceae bacterium]